MGGKFQANFRLNFIIIVCSWAFAWFVGKLPCFVGMPGSWANLPALWAFACFVGIFCLLRGHFCKFLSGIFAWFVGIACLKGAPPLPPPQPPPPRTPPHPPHKGLPGLLPCDGSVAGFRRMLVGFGSVLEMIWPETN